MEDTFLDNLKEDIVKELDPIMVDSTLTPEERFGFYLSIASSTRQESAFKSAFEAAKQIEDASVKASSLMDLLDLISEVQDLEYAEDSTEPEPEAKTD